MRLVRVLWGLLFGAIYGVGSGCVGLELTGFVADKLPPAVFSVILILYCFFVCFFFSVFLFLVILLLCSCAVHLSPIVASLLILSILKRS